MPRRVRSRRIAEDHLVEVEADVADVNKVGE